MHFVIARLILSGQLYWMESGSLPAAAPSAIALTATTTLVADGAAPRGVGPYSLGIASVSIDGVVLPQGTMMAVGAPLVGHASNGEYAMLVGPLSGLTPAVTRPPCEGDANSDDNVDPLDAGYVLARLGCSVGSGDAGCDAADVNHDQQVDPLDAGYVLARFGSCP